MENCLQFIPRKCYNTYGTVVLTLFFVTAVTLIGITSDLNANSNLRCNPGKNVAVDITQKTFVQTTCSLKYEQKYNSPVPFNWFVILNFGLVFVLCFIYAIRVKSRVERWDDKLTATTDVELQPLSQQSQRSQPNQEDDTKPRIPVFYIYLLHLVFFRLLPMILFVVLVLYPADFPTNFSCPWLSAGTSSNANKTDNTKRFNFTTVDCKNPSGSKSISLARAVWIVDIIFAFVTSVEAVYLVWRNCKDKYFACDYEFCSVYLLGKRKTIRKIMKNYRKKLANDQEVFKLDILSSQNGTLEKMYVKLIIQTGREDKEELLKKSKRHEIYQAYLETPENSILVKNIKDLFFLNEKRCCKILVVGRPGIGKTVLTKKILHQWTTSKDEFWSKKLVILLRFRTFNADKSKTTTLKNMFRLGEGLPSAGDFDRFYEHILSNPEKVILIFDGLDELKVDCDNCWTDEEDTPNDKNLCMSIFSVFKKLVCGKFLPGATVLITSRPTAEHIYDKLSFGCKFEILGFTKPEIQDYVKKFCQHDNDMSTRMWNLIEESAELLSLCYIPVSCFIICLTLKKCIEHERTNLGIPRTMTELYRRAIRIILWDHNPSFRNKTKRKDYFKANLPKDLQCTLDKLKTLAKTGIEKKELIFEIEPENECNPIMDCGLFNSLPNDESYYYCFLHLTIQEFLAALEIVDRISSPEDVESFLSTHIADPNWHLVIQFFAGLLADKFRKDKSSMEMMCKSFAEWTSSITSRQVAKKEKRVSLLMIKCLHETQESGIMESAASKVDGGGDGGCDLSGLDIAAVDCAALFKFLSHVGNFLRLDLAQNYIISCLELAKFLCGNNQVIDLNLLMNNINAESVKHLCDALKNKNCKLTNLCLSENNIKDEGVKQLGDALKNENCKLTNLNLGGNNINDEGVKHLCDALKNENCKLTNLKLSHNSINDEGVKHLCDALKNENCKLTNLILSKNNINDEGAKYLCDALKNENCKLTNLDLHHNKINDEGVKYLRDAAKIHNVKLFV